MMGSARNATWGTVFLLLLVAVVARFLFGQGKR